MAIRIISTKLPVTEVAIFSFRVPKYQAKYADPSFIRNLIEEAKSIPEEASFSETKDEDGFIWLWQWYVTSFSD